MNVKLMGRVLMAIGFGLLVAAFMMDTTVDTGYGQVYNIGLLSRQNTLSLLGALFLIAGIFLYVLVKEAQKKVITESDSQELTTEIEGKANWTLNDVFHPIKAWMDKRDFIIRLMVTVVVGVSSFLFFDNFLNIYTYSATIYILIRTPALKAVQHALIANTVLFIVIPILIISFAVIAKLSGITINNAEGVNGRLFESAVIGLSEISGWFRLVLFPIAISITSFRLIKVFKNKLISEKKPAN